MSANDLAPVCPDCGKELYMIAEDIYVPLPNKIIVGGTCLICEQVYQAAYTFTPTEETEIAGLETETQH